MTSSLRWAIYLGVSWTWCIGMFLPVLMVRDWGAWAFLIFALPNVLGAAAMGWVIPDAGASRRLVSGHTKAMVAFSQVTVAYQAFFAGWMLPGLIGWWTALFYPLIVVLMIVAVRRDREFSLISLLTWVLSLTLGAVLASRGLLTLPPVGSKDQFVSGVALAPVCLFGFLLCPYLDLTFHHALQKAYEAGGKVASRLAFTLGFVIVFGLMIVGTLYYANIVRNPTSAGRMLVGFHMLAQLTVTILLHFIRAGYALNSPKGMPAGPLMMLAAFVVGVALFYFSPYADQRWPWTPGEFLYRTFLVFYGLVFPAYVLTQLVPSRPSSTKSLAVAIGISLPFYAVGFYTSHVVWLGVGVVVALVACGLAIRLDSRRRVTDF